MISNTNGGTNGEYHVAIAPRSILQASTLYDAIQEQQTAPRLKTKNGTIVSELDMKDALIGRITRKSRIIHYGKHTETRKKVCPYLFKFEMTDASLLGAGNGHGLRVTCWDHLVPKLYHRLKVGSVICIFGYRWGSYKNVPEIKLNAGQSTILQINLDATNQHNQEEDDEESDAASEEEEEGEEEEQKKSKKGKRKRRTKVSSKKKRKTNSSSFSSSSNSQSILSYLHSRLPRPPMNLIETSELRYVPHRERFDFVGLLTYIGNIKRTRHVPRSTSNAVNDPNAANDDDDVDMNLEDPTLILYDTESGDLHNTDVDASFSEWRWLLFRDFSSTKTLSIKLFTNSRTRLFSNIDHGNRIRLKEIDDDSVGCNDINEYIGEMLCLSNLIMLTDINR